MRKDKSTGLAWEVRKLKQDLDVHEVISSNADLVEKSSYKFFLGYIFWRSLDLSILNTCKIYERGKTEAGGESYPLNSINGVKEAVRKNEIDFSTTQAEKFLETYPPQDGVPAESLLLQKLISATERFGNEHHPVISHLKKIRNEVIGHAQANTNIRSAPSFDSKWKLYKFAHEFCRCFVERNGLHSFEDLKIKQNTKNTIAKLLDIPIQDVAGRLE